MKTLKNLTAPLVLFAAATEGSPAAEDPAPKTRGRGPNPENAKRIEHILERTRTEPGVPSPALAKELEISTLQCSQLADRLVRKGEIKVVKIDGGVRTYYTPEDYEAEQANKPAEEPATQG